VPRRLTLVALWAVFAVASVGVGFAAASMVSDPFTDVDTTSQVSDLAGPAGDPFTDPTTTPRPTSSTSPSTGDKPSKSPTGGSSAGGTKSPNNSSATVKRGIPTRGGYVSATCRNGLVSVGAAPALYWQVESRTSPGVRTGRVRLEPATNANGERVEVTATCASGIPAFTSDYNEGSGGGDDGGGDSGGGGDDGGHGGSGGGGGDDGGKSGGSDDSSGSGSGE
jgi:hypothetical protein